MPMLCTSGYIDLIFRPSRPPQILNPVICPDAVDVINFLLAVGIRNECKSNEPMNSGWCLYSIIAKIDTTISTSYRKLQYLHLVKLDTPHQPRIADLVIGIAVDDAPLLHCGRVLLNYTHSFLLAVKDTDISNVPKTNHAFPPHQ